MNFENLKNSELIAMHKALLNKVRAQKEEVLMKRQRKDLLFQRSKERWNQTQPEQGNDFTEIMAKDKGRINETIWPFFFTSEFIEVGRGNNQQANITITQEAPFSVIGILPTVFEITDMGAPSADYDFVDYSFRNTSANLKFTMVDSQSRRSFFRNPISVEHLGSQQEPYIFPSPFLMEQNSNLEFNIFNQSTTKDYALSFMLIGYRIRIQDIENWLSLVSE